MISWTDNGAAVIERNIFSGSEGCAVLCRSEPQDVTMRDNLFWDSTPSHVGDEGGCFSDWEQDNVLTDPLFCDPANDDYRVQPGSPALTHPGGPIGAFTEPGCGSGQSMFHLGWQGLRPRH